MDFSLGTTLPRRSSRGVGFSFSNNDDGSAVVYQDGFELSFVFGESNRSSDTDSSVMYLDNFSLKWSFGTANRTDDLDSLNTTDFNMEFNYS